MRIDRLQACRVAARYVRRRAYETRRLDRKTQQAVNQDLIRAGLDGNMYFDKPQRGWAKAFDVLAYHGLEPDQVVHADTFRQDNGRTSVDIAFKSDDPFTPIPVTNSMPTMQWGLAGDRGRYDFVAYLS